MEFSVLYNLLLESGVELQTFGALWGYKAQFGVEKTLIVICQLPAARILPIETPRYDSMTAQSGCTKRGHIPNFSASCSDMAVPEEAESKAKAR